MNIPPRQTRQKLSYEEYEVYIDAAVQTGFGLTLDQMRMYYGYFIGPCNCGDPSICYPLCRGWVLYQDKAMARDIEAESEGNPPFFHGEEFYADEEDEE